MKVVIFGDDLVGLVTAASLAKVGNCVACVRLNSLNKEVCNEKWVNDEPGLSDLVEEQLLGGSFSFESSWSKVLDNYEVFFICLPNKRLQLADKIVKYIAENVQRDVIIVNQSASTIGTIDRFECIVREQLERRDVLFRVSAIAMPAFLSEGEAINNFMTPDRILLGAHDVVAATKISKLMRPFNLTDDKIKIMSARAAEYSKFAVNAVLATRMSLINEIANIAEGFDIDFEQVKQGLGADSRIGFHYINAGCGFGGPNFATDVENLVGFLADKDHDVQLLQKVLENNENQKEVMFRKVWRYFKTNIKNKTFAVWGLSFKPNTSTVENGSSIKTIESLLAQGANVVVYDPKAMDSFKRHCQAGECSVKYAKDMYSALENVDGLLVLTEWQQFYSPNFKEIKKLMARPVIFDGRNVFSPDTVIKEGFDYFGVGRGQRI